MDTGQATEPTNVHAVIDQARSGHAPSNWNVWPLRRDVVGRGMWGWVAIAFFGFIFFIPALFIMIPANFDGDPGKEVISVIILGLLGFMAFGAFYLFAADLQRLLLAAHYLLVMTPDDYIKVEPGRITHVPMDQIDDITLKGVVAEEDTTGYGPNGMDRLLGIFRRKPKVSPKLSFRDLRNNHEVIVSRDNAFDELAALDQVLRLHVGAKERTRRY